MCVCLNVLFLNISVRCLYWAQNNTLKQHLETGIIFFPILQMSKLRASDRKFFKITQQERIEGCVPK